MNNPSIVFSMKYFTYDDDSDANKFYRCKNSHNIINYLNRESSNDNLSETDQKIVNSFVELTNEPEKNIINYAPKKNNSTRLFTKSGLVKADELSKLEHKLSETKATIYSSVTSFSTDYGTNFLTTPEEGRQIVSDHLAVLLKDTELNIDNIEWCGAVHTDTAHHHIHLLFWEKEPQQIDSCGKLCFSKKNCLPKENLTLYKSAIAKSLKESSMDYFYLRDEIRAGALAAMKNNRALFNLFESNCGDIIEKGNFQYARLTRDQQRKVDKLVKRVIAMDKNLETKYNDYKNRLYNSQLDYISLVRENGAKTIPANISGFYSDRMNDLNTRCANGFLKMLKEYTIANNGFMAKYNIKEKQLRANSFHGANKSDYSVAKKMMYREADKFYGKLYSDFIKSTSLGLDTDTESVRNINSSIKSGNAPANLDHRALQLIKAIFQNSANADVQQDNKTLEQYRYEKAQKGESVIYENE